MKKTTFLIFAAFIFLVGFSIDSYAQSRNRSYSINSRERRQQKRIVSGVRNGRLTARETYRLERQQYRIRSQENRYRRSGGRFTWRERYLIQRRLNQSSRRIYRQKHDRQNYSRRRL